MRTWVCVGVRQYRDTRICTASMEPRASIFVAPEDAEAYLQSDRLSITEASVIGILAESTCEYKRKVGLQERDFIIYQRITT